MDKALVINKVAAELGRTVEALEKQGDTTRAERQQGWLGGIAWTVPEDVKMAELIDHTVLKPDATLDDVRKLCGEAVQYGFPAVCVNPVFVEEAAQTLAGTGVRVAAVVGFPLGAATSLVKGVETSDCIARGATEIDMVIHVGALKAGNLPAVFDDVATVVKAAGARALVKVILETAYLTDMEIATACLLCMWAGADYVKTSTGFGPAGANVPHITLMRATVGNKLGVKAAGGIKDATTARAMVKAGASRIGTSRGPQII